MRPLRTALLAVTAGLALIAPQIAAAAPDTFIPDGYVTVAFGKVKNPDGTWRDISGLRLPYRITPIFAKKIMTERQRIAQALTSPFEKILNATRYRGDNPFRALAPGARGTTSGGGTANAPTADQVVYSADAGSGYGYVEDDPSSLDDINISTAGVNKPLNKLTFGFQYNLPTFGNFLIRWRMYRNYNPIAAAVGDFYDEFADFGVIWNQSVPVNAASKVEISIAQAGVTPTQTSFYMAQQFRDASNLQGEGAFWLGVENVYNAAGEPSVGSSLDQFWYDWDPRDGNYKENEIDVFEANKADHLCVLKVSSTGTTANAFPTGFATYIGPTLSGTLTSILFPNDNNVFTGGPFFAGPRNSPLIGFQYDGIVGNTNITSISARTATIATAGPLTMRTSFFHFATNTWVQVDARPATTTMQTVDMTYGGVLPLAGFIGPGNAVRMRIDFFDVLGVLPRSWNCGVDLAQMTVTNP
ncbi:MAG: hypothetical protein JST35_05025 [Armatimonadetes bacterium]|nr:hypothetical protein [Armatimonadota bacterium]